MRERIVVTLVVVTGVVTGCGGGNSDIGKDPDGVVKTYLTAIADGDGKKACQQLSPRLQRRATKLVATAGRSAGTCEEALRTLAKEYDKREKELLRSARINKVTVRGTDASVTSSGTGLVKLTRSGDRWTIVDGVFG